MPPYKRELTTEEWMTIRHEQICELIKEDISNGRMPGSDWSFEIALEAVEQIMDWIGDEYTYESILSVTEASTYFPSENILDAGGSVEVIRELVREQMHSHIQEHLEENEHKAESVYQIQADLHKLYQVDPELSTPSDVLLTFNRWLVSNYTFPDDSDSDWVDSDGKVNIDEEAFNEAHIRGYEIISYHDDLLLDSLEQFIESRDIE